MVQVFLFIAGGLIVGALVGYVDEEGAIQKVFLGILALIGVGGAVGAFNQSVRKCETGDAITPAQDATTCETGASMSMIGLVAFAVFCGIGYGFGQERRRSRKSN